MIPVNRMRGGGRRSMGKKITHALSISASAFEEAETAAA